ncbi:MAG: bifunctional DNA-formamidopyrimidine glycosylase/DNA-(apurinic or apyrimidinic site) lyase [Bacteriovoracaceae bacterium]
MPELPEVETVKRGLEEILGTKAVIKKIKVLNPKLRFPVPSEVSKLIKNAPIQKLSRRAKYLFFELDKYVLSSHLGMTGTWRIYADDRKKHDHVEIHLEDGRVLVYADPRKFGLFEFFKKSEDYHRLGHLGPEPLSDEFNSEYLWEKTRKKQVAIKNLIMNQEIVVGVGNIYASEALFLTGVRPTRKSGKITKKECEELVIHIKSVLDKAIQAGGSTISDFKKAGGDAGYFQHSFKVYGREKEACSVCSTTIKNTTIGGRSSFWCPSCQK